MFLFKNWNPFRYGWRSVRAVFLLIQLYRTRPSGSARVRPRISSVVILLWPRFNSWHEHLTSAVLEHLESVQDQNSATCAGHCAPRCMGSDYSFCMASEQKVPEKACPLFSLEFQKILKKQWPTLSLRGFQPWSPRLDREESNVWRCEVNLWLWQFGRVKPCLWGLFMADIAAEDSRTELQAEGLSSAIEICKCP